MDIDDTLSPAPGGVLYSALPLWLCPPPPLPGAAGALNRLAQDYRLLFLTARSSVVARGTLKWLDHWRFPRAPVIFSRRFFLNADEQVAFKTGVLRGLEARGQPVRWGIGDKVSDVLAYRAVGANAILLAENSRDEDALLLARCVPHFPAERLIVGHGEAWRRVEALVVRANQR